MYKAFREGKGAYSFVARLKSLDHIPRIPLETGGKRGVVGYPTGHIQALWMACFVLAVYAALF